MEVAALCLRLHATCREGDFSFAQQFLEAIPSAPVDLTQCQGIDTTQYATDEDGLVDQMQGMELESGEGSGSDEGEPDESMGQAEGHPQPSKGNLQQSGQEEGSPAAQEAPRVGSGASGKGVGEQRRAPPEEPVVDEDGFTSVVKGRRRPR
mmetsp:Transcript_42232/g.131386  ORF Transcript_42232/g.131386 Transcript_42232/m.131386 type:complete len:151 (+) Transcript_42232:198-650(+)